MILTLIAVLAIVITVFIFRIAVEYDGTNKLCQWIYYNDDIAAFICGILIILSSLIILIGGVVFALEHVNPDREIMLRQMEKEKILSKIESLNNDYEKVSKIEVIEEIYEWNREVESRKHWTYSPWTNWFCSKKITDSMDYIVLEEN